jgi:hypothetical protein
VAAWPSAPFHLRKKPSGSWPEKRTRPQRRAPPPLGRSLGKTLRELDAKFGQGPGALAARWREVVGVEIAKRTEVVKLTKGRNGAPSSLEIRVAGPSAAIIQHRAHEILVRREPLPRRRRRAEAADRAGAAQAAKQPRRRNAAVLPPLDAAEEAKLAADLAEAPDGKLKSPSWRSVGASCDNVDEIPQRSHRLWMGVKVGGAAGIAL